jgi:Domain of unknown function (DUF4338)
MTAPNQRRIAEELESRFGRLRRCCGHPVYSLEIFVHRDRKGTCYRAANWIALGWTTGRGKASNSHRPNRPRKQVLGYSLHRHSQRHLDGL